MVDGAPASLEARRSGRGDDVRPGRSFSFPRSARHSRVAQAMERLLVLGGVRARSGLLRVRGTRIHYLEAGAGSPLLLLHGAGGGAANWFRILGPLADRYRLIAPDLPGFGLSDNVAPPLPLGGQLAALLSDFADAVGVGDAAVLGTSLGGLVALRLAQLRPRLVRRLALLDSAGLGRALPAALRLAALPAIGDALLRPTRQGTEWSFRRLATANRSELSTREEAALLDYLHAVAEAAPPGLLASGLRAFVGAAGQREVLTDAEMAAIAAPTLVLWGERDGFFPLRHARRAVARLPRATLVAIPDAGHSPNWEAPVPLLRALLPFLSAEPAGSGARDGRLDARSGGPLG